MAGLSAGRLPELSGTLPDLGVNPIPHSDSLTTSTGGLDILGVEVGVNRYSASIDTGMGSGSHAAVVPTMLVGLRLGGPGCWPFCRPDDPRLFSFGAEAQGAWLRQRDGRRDFVPTLRVFLSVGVRVPERTRVGYRAPPRRGCS
jgi:hypothetical protein